MSLSWHSTNAEITTDEQIVLPSEKLYKVKTLLVLKHSTTSSPIRTHVAQDVFLYKTLKDT